MEKKKFSSVVSKALKYYVYLYVHPESGEIFYVGKGKGNRVFSHLHDEVDSDKSRVIKEIRRQGLEPKIEILIHGLEDEVTALRVESAVIDLLRIHNLTNRQSGYKSALYGRMTVDQIISTYDGQKVDISEPAILIRIKQAFRYSMSEMELYDFTRGQWRLNPVRAKRAKYAFAVYEGIIQEVYEILDWYEAGKTFSVRDMNLSAGVHDKTALAGRYEFVVLLSCLCGSPS